MRPYIIISSTMTIDGKIAAKDSFSELSCRYDKIRQHMLRAQVDAVMIGARTARVDNPRLTLKYYTGKNPIRVIVTNSGDLDPGLKIFNIPPSTVVYTRNLSDSLKELTKKGVYVRTFSTLCDAMADLYKTFSVRTVMVEGGGKLNWSLMKEGCVDEVRVTVSPRVFGSGTSIFDGDGFPGSMSPTLKLHSAYRCQCGEEIVLIYKK
ncbi:MULTISPECIES: 2,5-diamino-6-(ribosylamino)-4(3H)-pyrimidinone 5'-phosphate reductase [Metallosphaera]|uniref:2,5-diamino-6-(ribosylamino)-4(3H)-pyrimidinone 5'-phosphate reductase n=3 Tax=Metallosphaera TaxID=41980 RepID=A4YCP6_METS5|nr:MULTISPECIES: 2,5-diamino-6-(ribosylamino)-4(3H)-pyrimidinone 5'-phosphate reductase [Metallosphaera]ABP94198.1 2,5-diamino-6-(5-phosphoribosylamino)pyrimidin-4(3H)-one reductase [Metallosphaera sedula DSM 5348]AIM26185.1 2,5-diamino-6-(5-phosphoribosylamino)pyrimidin-4(3H)-one reductase [Metallosphaera sedula]AKV73212.1 5-amino-6-(5-phosphoribosylamino)uracil reductase [Metallosphaera sedula]AKV75456.1 5-amino-6-(5-phosphoribosylamino)uracil reductase [Metallosphaera sedula]AKV77702.1 5-am